MAGLKKQYYTLNGRILGEEVIGGSGVRNYLTDALDSVVHTVTPAGGIENSYAYKPYGGQLSKVGSAPDPAFTWNGGLGYRMSNRAFAGAYVRSRHEATESGRWVTVDRVWPTLAAYPYCNNSPVELVDPLGASTYTTCVNGYLQQAVPPVDACIICKITIAHWSWGAAKDFCKTVPPKPVGPGLPRYGVPVHDPKTEKPEPPPWVSVVTTACGEPIGGLELSGLIGAGSSALCASFLPQFKRNYLYPYCGDESGRFRWPQATDEYWKNYCDNVRYYITQWDNYCSKVG